MSELKPCPLCGGEASKRLFYKGKYRVHCNVCDAHSGDVCDTEAEAIAAWNTRADMSEVDYLATAKRHIAQIDGNHPAEYVKAFALAAIANALIAIAERIEKK